MLNQHLPHVSIRNAGVDALLSMLKELTRGIREGPVGRVRVLDALTQGLQDRRKIFLELRYRLAKIGDLGALIAEE